MTDTKSVNAKEFLAKVEQQVTKPGVLGISIIGAVKCLLETAPDASAPVWTPCSEGMPTNSARYKVTLQVGSEAGTWLETAIIPYRYCDGTGEWILPKSDWLIYGVIAWTKADEPYNPDQFRDSTKMIVEQQ